MGTDEFQLWQISTPDGSLERYVRPRFKNHPLTADSSYTATMATKTRSSSHKISKTPVKKRVGGTKKPASRAKKAALGFRRWTKAEAAEAFRRFRKANPDPKTELKFTNAFTLVVAVALSAQATDAGVNKATAALFAIADTPQKMAALGEEKLREYIKTIGLYRTKAKNVIALSQKLITDFGGEVPRNREALESLPGVGRKTANVVLNVVFGEPTMAVDTHIFRVSNRTGLAPGKTPLEVELGLLDIIPAEFMAHAHHWLILHGRYTCIARRPLCEKCVINDLCRWPEKTV
jgi:endonuclease III